MSANFVLEKSYNFKVWPSQILGDNFDNVLVLSQMTARAAMAAGVDINTLHAQVYPSLPAGTPDSALQYSYVQVQLMNGSTTVLGLPWIRDDTVEEVGAQTATLTIPNVTSADAQRLVNALTSNGFVLGSISFK